MRSVALLLLILSPMLAKECGNVDVRNKVAEFQELEGCHVVEGSVQIVLMDRANESDYQNVSFPLLREITGYLLLYRVKGLKSIGQLFPNLAVIRGNKLFNNYALVVYEMFHLQEIGLHGLTKILRGAVRIEKNPNLCFVDTVDWNVISNATHFIGGNKDSEGCPGSVQCSVIGCKKSLCWSSKHCQKLHQDNCHDMCLGGCAGPGPRDCMVCKDVLLDGECVKTCPPDRFEYLHRRCVTDAQCRNLLTDDGGTGLILHFPAEGVCSSRCPARHEVSSDRSTCVPCQGVCRIECGDGESLDLETLEMVQELHGCTHFNGTLTIRLQEDEDIMSELEKSLGALEEISGSLKVMRSNSLTSLNFLKSLTVIHGNKSDSNKSALVVVNNQNLQQLWDWNSRPKNLRILNGGLFFHYNPRLCISEIEKLREKSGAPNYTNLEVARESNGDETSCDVVIFSANATVINSTSVLFEWDNHFVGRTSLMGFTLHYVESEDPNITIHVGKDMCDVCNWVVEYIMLTTDNMNLSKIQFQLSDLKPYSMYAFYVKTYIASAYEQERRSEIHRFRTYPDRPSIPRSVKAIVNSSSEATVVWEPPLHPHGNITHYLILGWWQPDDESFLEQRDFCMFPINNKRVEDNLRETTAAPNTTQQDCCPCVKEKRCINTDPKMNYMFKSGIFVDENEICDDEDVFYSVFYSTRLFGNGGGMFRNLHAQNLTNMIESTIPTLTEESTDLDFGDNLASHEMYRRFHRKVDATKNSTVLRNLKHFAEYIIKIVACRTRYGDLIDDNLYENSCSPANMITLRTKKLDSADSIPTKNVKVDILNKTYSVKIWWPKPETPNSFVVAYHVEYRRADIEHSKPNLTCITNAEHERYGRVYLLHSLPPGEYAIRIQVISLAGEGKFTDFVNFTLVDDQNFGSFGGKLTALISVFVLVLIAVVTLGLFLWKKIKQSSRSDVLITTVNPKYISLSSYVEDEWEIARDKVELIKELSHGSFGLVYEGILQPANIRCAVKTVSDKATIVDKIEFLNEASVMKSFPAGHHVVRLLGVVSKGQPPLVVMELMTLGDLKSYLRSIRDTPTDMPDLECNLLMAAQIADGMSYLEASKFVHRDLAARNCMVTENLTVKIGDFGMTRDIYETDYYRKGNKGFLPIRWMAPESLEDGVFTSQSDVWSYGVVLWEIATLSEQPYQGQSNEQVLHFVLDGGLLERPSNCQDVLYQLMLACWQLRPANRPNFQQLVGTLEAVADLPMTFKTASFYHSTAGQLLRDISNDDGPSPNDVISVERQELQPLTYQDDFDAPEQSTSFSRIHANINNSTRPYVNIHQI